MHLLQKASVSIRRQKYVIHNDDNNKNRNKYIQLFNWYTFYFVTKISLGSEYILWAIISEFMRSNCTIRKVQQTVTEKAKMIVTRSTNYAVGSSVNERLKKE